MTFSMMCQFRLYPSGKQQVKLLNQFSVCKEVYNILLGENKEHFFTSRYDFNSLVSDIKITLPEPTAQVHSQVLQNVSDRLHKALDNFFGRVKLGKQGRKVKAGFPRFKSRIQSITYPQSGFKFLSNKKLKVSKIGSVPIILHRLPKGKIKTMTVKQNKAGQWFAVFSCEVDVPAIKHANRKVIGIDVGLEKFLTDNKGQSIANPRFYLHAENRLARLQRVYSKRVKGSKNSEKARVKVARQHLKVFNQRSDFLHKASHSLTINYGIIAGEYLNIQSMVEGNLAKHILDVSWGRFYQMLSYKAVTCGGELRKNPRTRGSSHRCSGCGFYVEDILLSERTFKCPKCFVVLHRDVNSSCNHVKDTVGMDYAEPNACGDSTSTSALAGASGVVESGTINDC